MDVKYFESGGYVSNMMNQTVDDSVRLVNFGDLGPL